MKKLKPVIYILRTLLTAIEIADDPVIIDRHFKELISTAEHAKRELRNETIRKEVITNGRQHSHQVRP